MHVKSIEVTIAGRSYPVKVTEDEEAVVLAAAKEINQKIRDYQNAYTNKDKQDCLSMALLTYAVEYAKMQASEDLFEQIGTASRDIRAALDQIA